jgi:hypothetical protein
LTLHLIKKIYATVIFYNLFYCEIFLIIIYLFYYLYKKLNKTTDQTYFIKNKKRNLEREVIVRLNSGYCFTVLLPTWRSTAPSGRSFLGHLFGSSELSSILLKKPPLKYEQEFWDARRAAPIIFLFLSLLLFVIVPTVLFNSSKQSPGGA